eukprot:364612-Chlamydomonas_euryale.AAC.16
MDEDRSPRQTGSQNIEAFSGVSSSAIRGCHEEGSSGGTTFRDPLKLPSHTKLILWPEIRAAAAEPWTGRPGRTLLETLLHWNLRSPIRLDAQYCLALAMAQVANVVQPFLVCDLVAGVAVAPGLGLVDGALCNDCDLAAEHIEVMRPEEPV